MYVLVCFVSKATFTPDILYVAGYKLYRRVEHCIELVSVSMYVCLAVCVYVYVSDTRKALCYTNIRDDRCLNPSTIPVTRSTCCCMVDDVEPVRIGWGQPCTVCPPVDLDEYQLLCPYGPGLTNTGAGRSLSCHVLSLLYTVTVTVTVYVHLV